MNAHDALMDNLYQCLVQDGTHPQIFTDIEPSGPVARGEYRFLLMEYTRLMMELADYKEKYKTQKRVLYAALNDWSIYAGMGTEHRALLETLKKEFEAEGSLEE